MPGYIRRVHRPGIWLGPGDSGRRLPGCDFWDDIAIAWTLLFESADADAIPVRERFGGNSSVNGPIADLQLLGALCGRPALSGEWQRRGTARAGQSSGLLPCRSQYSEYLLFASGLLHRSFDNAPFDK